MEMEGIEHRTVEVNGIKMHVAEKGHGPEVILFLHGFPELWYTWRHQLHYFAAAGYRAVAPDLRGYGETDAPCDASSYTCFHVVGDLVALVQSIVCGKIKIYLVGHDWGAIMGWYLCMFRPDLIKAFVAVSVPFRARNPTMRPVQAMRAFFGDDYYICRFQEAGMIESEIAKHGSKKILRKILAGRKPGPPYLAKENPFQICDDDGEMSKLPSWISEQDLDYCASKYDAKGFTGGLNYYRALDLNWELTAAWTGVKVEVPVKYIVGEIDMVYTTPGAKEYVHGGAFKKDVPLLEETIVIQGAGHFLNQEKPDQINQHIHQFINKF